MDGQQLSSPLCWEYSPDSEYFNAPEAFYLYFGIAPDANTALDELTQLLSSEANSYISFEEWLNTSPTQQATFTFHRNGEEHSTYWQIAPCIEQQKRIGMVRDTNPVKTHDLASILLDLSHDLRSHLNNLAGMNAILRDTYLDETQLSYLIHADNAQHSLYHICNSIVNLARLEKQSYTPAISSFYIDDFIHECLHRVAGPALLKGIELVWQPHNALPEIISTHTTLLKETLLHVLQFAIAHTISDYMLLDISEENAQLHIKLSYESDGTTPPLDMLTTSSSELALYTHALLIEQASGSLCYAETKQQHAEWTLTLPVTATNQSFIPSDTALIEILDGKRCLIVDDMEPNGFLLQRILAHTNTSCTYEKNPTVALSHMQEAIRSGNGYDMVVIDYLMPEMDGKTLGLSIKEDASLQRTPIVMMSAADNPALEQLFSDAGFQGYIEKPLHESAIHQLLAHVLRASNEEKHSFITPKQIISKSPEPLLCCINGNQPRVLLLEDSPTDARTVKRRLENTGCKIYVAQDTETLNHLLADRVFDLMVMDLHVNGQHATDIVTSLQATKMALPPIVGISATVDAAIIRECQQADIKTVFDKSDLSAFTEKLSSLFPEHFIRQRAGERADIRNTSRYLFSDYIDFEQVRYLRDTLGENGFHEAMQSFHLLWKRELDAMKYAMADTNPHSVSQSARMIEDAAAQIGLVNLSRLTQAIQKELLKNDTPDMEKIIPIQQRLGEILEESNQLLRQSAA